MGGGGRGVIQGLDFSFCFVCQIEYFSFSRFFNY